MLLLLLLRLTKLIEFCAQSVAHLDQLLFLPRQQRDVLRRLSQLLLHLDHGYVGRTSLPPGGQSRIGQAVIREHLLLALHQPRDLVLKLLNEQLLETQMLPLQITTHKIEQILPFCSWRRNCYSFNHSHNRTNFTILKHQLQQFYLMQNNLFPVYLFLPN